FERALDAYREAVEKGDPALEAKAWYNLGNALYRQQQLPEALEAYKQALRRDPGDVDAKHNLELVLEQLQQQQQPQPQDQEEQQDQQEEQQQQSQGEEEDQRRQQDQQDQQDQSQDEEQGQEQGQPEREQEASGEEQPPQPQPGQMSREEAERLLQAIKEDPDKISRKRIPVAERRKPKKDW
ncbi:MAG: tetratricopeptide repeat protein, partial [Gemmatimonadales bacterium]